MADDTPPPVPSGQPFTAVCAIGASAGGVDALRAFFRRLPPDLGLAYVVIVHLAPDQPSALSQILDGCTRMPVVQVEDSPTLMPNRVYVIPPNRQLVIDGDAITLREFDEPHGRRSPIDFFFRSVAAGRGDGMALILSGAGADGADGIKAIKEAGGVIFVQEPAEARFPSMPQNAIATGAADFVAPIARLAERIGEVARSKEAVRSLDMDGAANDLRRIVTFLRTRTGHDFSSYKRATVMRRVTRRMQVRRLASLADYADLLREAPDEAQELLSDLLISVTSFFRDARAFEELRRQAIGPLFDEAAEDGVRAWVVGCATGEEAYSLAMLMLEEARRRELRVPIQIFASDLDEGRLATAREGRYPRSIEADVPEERLQRFFVDEGTHYRVRKEVRDTILFTPHSVLKDPPFTRLDLVSCRNLMIYLERSLQMQVCSIFHYGLKPGRCLFLGSAETIDMGSDLFLPVDREARIYRSRPQAAFALPIVPQAPATPRGPPAAPAAAAAAWRFAERAGLSAETHAAALERVAPPSILVDEAQTVVHLSPTAGRFILHSAGPLSPRLSAVVRPELRLDLELALSRAFDGRLPTLTHPVTVDFDGSPRRVAMHVAPVPGGDRAPTRAVVFFVDGGPAGKREQEETAGEAGPDELRRLHAELKAAQDAALASRVEHEASMQDLRAANEELQSINEEYRSTSEELETSKEELQSINEELQTVNAELKAKVDDISIAHDDLRNLTDSSEIGTLFLDTGLRIRMFTPPVADLINVTEADAGRAITDFTHRLDYDGIERDVRRVLRDLTPLETEIRSLDGRWFMMRVRLYRTLDNRIEGAVVTFDEITARKRDAALLRESEAKYRGLFESIDTGFCIIEMIFDAAGRPVDYVFLEANPAFRGQTGLLDAVGRPVRSMIPAHEEFWFETYGRIARTGVPERFEHRADAIDRWYSVYAFRVGEPEQHRVAVLFEDVLVRKRAEAALLESERQQVFLLHLSDALRPLNDAGDAKRTAARLLGEHLDVDRTFLTEVDPDGGTLWVREEHLRSGASSVLGRYRFDQFGAFVRGELEAGRTLAVADVSARPDLDEAERATYAGIGIAAYLLVPLVRDGRLAAYFTLNHRTPHRWSEADTALVRQVADRTWAAVERARAEAALHESEELQRLTLELVPALLWWADPAGERITGIHRWQNYTGQTEEEVQSFGWLDAIHPDDLPATRAAFEHAFATGEPVERQQRIRRNGHGYRWHLVRHVPVRDESGAIARWFGAAVDVDEIRRMQEEQSVLIAELHHRTRNLIGVTGMIMRRVLASSTSLADFRTRFTERLDALSRVQSLLSRPKEERINIGDIVRVELDALGADLASDRVRLGGEAVPLRRSAVQTLALAIHELATNARKYGALRAEAGRLAVRWGAYRTDAGERRLRFEWTETDIDREVEETAGPPHGGGYGRKLIEEALPYTLKARTTYMLGQGRLDCSIDMPLDD